MTNKNEQFQQDPNFQRFAKGLRQLDDEQISSLWEVIQDTELASIMAQTHQELTKLLEEMTKNSEKILTDSVQLYDRILKLNDRMKNAKLHIMDQNKLQRLEQEAEQEKKKLNNDMQFGA